MENVYGNNFTDGTEKLVSHISPDGNWIAFISDRGGQWAVWVTPTADGMAQELFDLPTINPWGDGDRIWTNERISWGPSSNIHD